jgi:hypothetical protein
MARAVPNTRSIRAIEVESASGISRPNTVATRVSRSVGAAVVEVTLSSS